MVYIPVQVTEVLINRLYRELVKARVQGFDLSVKARVQGFDLLNLLEICLELEIRIIFNIQCSLTRPHKTVLPSEIPILERRIMNWETDNGFVSASAI